MESPWKTIDRAGRSAFIAGMGELQTGARQSGRLTRMTQEPTSAGAHLPTTPSTEHMAPEVRRFYQKNSDFACLRVFPRARRLGWLSVNVRKKP